MSGVILVGVALAATIFLAGFRHLVNHWTRESTEAVKQLARTLKTRDQDGPKR